MYQFAQILRKFNHVSIAHEIPRCDAMTAGYPDQVTAIPSWTHRDLALVAALMFTALLLRIPGLGEGLWIDLLAACKIPWYGMQ